MFICKTFLIFTFVFSTSISLSVSEISVSESSARIVNGFEVDITEVPYQAALRRRVLSGWAHSCGAVIITVRALLTAAHCVEDYVSEPSQLRVIVGTSYRLSGGKSYDVSEAIMHEAYSSITLEHDIGMLVTKSKISFSQSIKAISFASENFELPAGTQALVSGYGTVSYDGSSSSVLLAAHVYIIDSKVCTEAYRYIATVVPGMICANASDPQRDACRGDSGGPLVANGNVVGIVSWGEGCAEPMYPGVYTRISTYSSWIRQKLAQIY